MELPIAQESYRPSNAALTRAIKRAAVVLGRMAGEEAALTGATAITNADRPDVRVANFAGEVHLPDGADANEVVGEIQTHFREQNATCHLLDGAEEEWPAELAAALEAADYTPRTKHVFLLSKFEPADDPGSHQIIPARAAYGEIRDLYLQMATSEFNADEQLAKNLADAMIDRLDEPRLELFMARVDQKPAALAGLVTLGQIGVIVPAYSAPAARGTGAGKAVMQHTLEYCHRAQFEQVIVDRSDGCYAIPFYERLGFEKISSYVKYYA